MARVALALGSGGARGYAHIGVIHELEARGHEVVAIAGASMGALVGGMAAAGKLSEFTDWAVALTPRDVIRLVDPQWSSPGVVAAQRVFDEIRGFAGHHLIEELPIPFTAVATDLHARREVWFQRGRLISAIRASVAIPGVFTPVVMNGRLLGDGGILNPVPIEPMAAAVADLTVAVSLQGDRYPRDPGSPAREQAAPSWRDTLVEKVRRRIGRSGGSEPVDEAEALLENLGISDVVGLSTDAMQALITRYRMAGLPPDVLITVPIGAARSLELYRAAEMIDLGRALAAEALDAAGV